MSNDALPSALVESIREDAYPNSANIASAEVTEDAVKSSLALVKQEKEALEHEIRTTSRRQASSVDDWISRARQLTADLEKAKTIAREIVRDNEVGSGLSSNIEDARAKHGLLRVEIDFNDKVVRSFGIIQSIQSDTDAAAEAVTRYHLIEASKTILKAEQDLNHYTRTLGSNITEILGRRVSNTKDTAVNGLQVAFASMVKLDHPDGASKAALSCIEQGKVSGKSYELNSIAKALKDLQSFDRTLDRLSVHVNRRLLHPVLSRSQSKTTALRKRNNSTIESYVELEPSTVSHVVESLSVFSNFLQFSVPDSIGSELAQKTLPDAVDTVINDWLTPSIPHSFSDLRALSTIQGLARKLSDSLPQVVVDSREQLVEWADRTPRLWVSKRRTAILDDVRAILRASKGERKTVERIEKQKMSKHEEVFASNATIGEWDVEWEDDEEAPPSPKKDLNDGTTDDDDSGWGFDDSTDNVETSSNTQHQEHKPQSTDEDEEDDAWGWGDDADTNKNEGESPLQPKRLHLRAVNGQKSGTNNGNDSEREVVLKELYTITNIPEKILDLIKHQVEDAKEIRNATDSVLDKATSSAALLTLPTLILAMFRATASAFYTSGMQGGQMHFYNDCMFLADQLRDLCTQPDLSKLINDIAALEKYAKSAYSQEMDTQRIILNDLLDGAQGFSSCTQQPFAAECETAVSSTVARLRLLYQEWKQILSHSALLQSLGSLLTRVIDKITRDIEDMEDISDPESQRLAAFCNQIAELEDLFLPPNAATLQDQSDVVPLTAVCVSNWLRFRYLAEILESKLVDIKYLWTEGELSLEFSVEEVVDLIKALFADSHYRKEAIAEIRKHAR
ncbi:MAG: hypothetical protein Q9160_006486 [Pyrenula sp. 1 TL-2023]